MFLTNFITGYILLVYLVLSIYTVLQMKSSGMTFLSNDYAWTFEYILTRKR